MRRTFRWAISLGVAVLWPAQLLASPGTGILFGTEGAGGALIRINTSTGAGTPVGSPGVGPLPSLAVDPTTGIMYAGGGGGNSNLYVIDKNTAAPTLVGNTGLGIAAIGALDFDSAGTLYAAVNIAGDGGTGSDHLATIDKTTGVATVIGPFGSCIGVVIPSVGGGSCSIEGMEGIAFAPGGALYGSLTARGSQVSGALPGLWSINKTTGAATFLTDVFDAAGFPPSGGLSSLEFRCDGTLFGGTAKGFGAADGGNLVTINPATGAFTTVGNAVPSGSSLAALAFQFPCKPTAAPALTPIGVGVLALVLAGIGVRGLTVRRRA